MNRITSPRPAHLTRLAPFLLTALAALALLGFGARQAQAITYFVATPSVGDGSGSSWSNAGPLQPILSAAHSGDQVWVKAGVYIGSFTATDGVAVYGHFFGTETTIGQRQLTNTTSAYISYLDGNGGNVYTIPSAATGTNTLDGFTVKNGGRGLNDPSNDALVLANSVFNNNYSNTGIAAGVYAGGLTCVATDCTFTNNSVSEYGGGIYVDSNTIATLKGCTFIGNSGGYAGGGIYSNGTITVEKDESGNDSYFTSNSGGGIYVNSNSTATISDSIFTGNSAGGGIYSYGTPAIFNCTFDSNSPDAIDLQDTGTSSAPAFVKDCLIVGGGKSSGDPNGIDLGIGGDSATFVYADILNNTIANTYTAINVGTGSGKVISANNILYNGEVGLSSNTTILSAESHNDYFDNPHNVEGVSLDPTDLTVDPQFVNPGGGDYHLSSSSPMIDAGDNSYYTSGDTDLDGHPRIQGARIDIGCYEFTITSAQLTSLSPASVTAGSPAFILTINGTGFFSGAVVHFGATSLMTTYVSSTKLTATVPASDVATAGTVSVTVVNTGVAASNALTFTITATFWTATAVSAAPGGMGHILWTRSDGAMSLWTLNSSDVEITEGPVYGPYSGWSAKAIATANDGTSRVLWTNTNGDAGVWTFSANDVETIIGTTYGPYTGWSAKSIGVAGDGTSRVLWTNVNGMAGVWSFNTSDVETIIGPTYGPYTGWTAKSISATSDYSSRVLWTNTNGTAGLWSFNANDVETKMGTVYGPYAGWSAGAVGTAGDGTSRVLWTNVNGEAGLWSFGANDVETIIGPTYGPISGWGAVALGVAADGTSRVLWDNANRSAGVWSFNANDVRTVIGGTYGPY